VGMGLTLKSIPFDESVAIAPCDPKTGSNCQWQMDWDGSGWTYSPDSYPTGGEIFETGAGANKGGYSNRVNDANIAATHHVSGPQALTRYQNFLAQQLPTLWVPWAPAQLSEVSHQLRGTLPQDPILNIYPETWRVAG